MRTPIHAGVAAFLVFAIAALPISAAKKSAAPKPADFRKLQIAVNGLLEWKVGLPGNASGTLTLFETADKALAAELGFIEGYSTQKVSAEIAKNLDSNLSPEELTSIKSKLDGIKIKMPAYHVESLGTDETSDRKTFEFAKALGVETIVTAADPAGFAAIDKLANEFNINVAVAGHSDPKSLMTALEPHSSHLGVDADLALWMQQGSKPVDALSMVGRRLFVVELSDQSAVGKKGHPVVLGTGAGDIRGFLLAMSRVRRPDSLVSPSHCGDCSRALVGFKPVFLAIGRDATSPEALSQTVVAFEKAVQPAMGDFVGESSRVIAITSPDLVPAEDRQKIDAALPREAPAKPKKPRKLLVLDLCPAGGFYHTTIAHANLALELMAKYTGAYEPVFSNDLDNLKYPKIKQFDAVFLNSVVGEDFVDPDVLNGLLRFVREGGGVAGIHGSTYASLDIPAYGDMIGAGDGPHKVETVILKLDDPHSPLMKPFLNSPLTASFGGTEFRYTDEFYHFLPTGPYSREKLHVLLSIDTQKSDMTGWNVRPDNDYGLSWIRSYGKGRVFNCALGHTPTLFETPALAGFILSGIQYALGDLPADSTPSAELTSKSAVPAGR